MRIETVVIVCLCAWNSLADPDTTARIVGGADAAKGAAPYQCSLKMLRQNSHYICGCAILNDKWILTAAHCLVGFKREDITIFVGSNQLMEGVRYKVDKLLPHKKFNGETVENDIGLIHVRHPIKFNELVQPIEIWTEKVPPNSILTLTGWGKLAYESAVTPKNLQTINLKLFDFKKCRQIWALNHIHVASGQICTLNGIGEGGCKGDSGGPLTFNGKLLGIVSFGIPCAVGMPDVYSDVRYHSRWINFTIIANTLK